MGEGAQLLAYRWYCGDDVCDCTQYRVERKTPRRTPFGHKASPLYDTVWAGQFNTDSGELTRSERAGLLWEFRRAAHANGIKLARTGFGWEGQRVEAGTPSGNAPRSQRSDFVSRDDSRPE